MAATLIRAIAMTGWLPAAAAAQPLHDPTQPPSTPATAPAHAATAAPTAPLQFTRRGPGDRFSALLAGQWVADGDRLVLDGAELQVLRVTESSVVLRRDGERQVIDMAPQAARAVRVREPTPSGSRR